MAVDWKTQKIINSVNDLESDQRERNTNLVNWNIDQMTLSRME